MKHHGIATAKCVSEEITAKLMELKCKIDNGNQGQHGVSYACMKVMWGAPTHM